MSHVSDVYASEMWSNKKGHAIWFPELPDADDIEIGDVGFIGEEGAFVRLLNAMRPREKALNAEEDKFLQTLEPLTYDVDHLDSKRPDAIQARSLFSQSMKCDIYDMRAEASGMQGVGGAGIRYECRCQDAKGALLLLGPDSGADQLLVHNNAKFRDHMKRYYKTWFKFATVFKAHVLQRFDIVLIRGWLKTDRWTIGAVHSDANSRGGGLKFSFDAVAAGGGVGFELTQAIRNDHSLEWRTIPRHVLAASQHKALDFVHSHQVGPMNLRQLSSAPATGRRHGQHTPQIPAEHPQPQFPIGRYSIFLKYYRLKSRAACPWWTKLEAAAGDHHLPGPPDGDRRPSAAVRAQDGTVEDSEESDLQGNHSDPVEAVLDYILKHSTADFAIACDDDFNDLLMDQPWPQDLRQWLEVRRPNIVVDEENVGTISLIETIQCARSDNIRRMRQSEGCTISSLQTAQNSHDILAKGSMALQDGITLNRALGWPHVRLADSTKRTSVVATSVSADAKLLVAAYTDRCVRVWRISDGQLMQRWYGHGDAIQCVAVAPYAPLRVASGSADAAVIIWDLSSCKAVAQLDGHITAIVSLVYSPDGQTLVSGSLDGTVKLWRVRSGHKLIHTMGGGSALADGGAQLAFAPDGARVVSTMGDVGRVWDAHSGTLLASLRGHTAPIRCMALSSDGGRVVTGSQDGTCRVWDTADGRELAVTDRAWPVTSMALSPDDEQIVVSSGGVVAAYAMDDGRALRRFVGPAPAPGVPPPVDSQSQCVACCPYSAFVASGAADGSVRLWNKESGALVGEYRGHEGAVRSVLFSGDGRDLYSSSDDGSLRIWSVTDVLRLLP